MMAKITVFVWVLAFILIMLGAAWPTVTGTIGFGAAGLGAFIMAIWLAEDDARRG